MHLSFVIVSFKSLHLLDKIIKNIPKGNEIIIIENSRDELLKTKIENSYNNVQVIIPKKNLGYGGALNLGIAKSKNKYVMCMVTDININNKCIIEILNILKVFDDFSIMTPGYPDRGTYKNYIKSKNYSDKSIKISGNILKEVDEINGAIMILNKKKFINKEIFDENIFLYFEDNDICLRVKKDNGKIYIIENLKFSHYGQKSSHPSLYNEVLKSRSWHYCWSKFYFYKKHFSYLFALRKTFPNFIKALKYCIYCKIKKDDVKFQLHKHEILGLLNSYFLKKSNYRINID